MRSALSGKIGTCCVVLQDELLDRSSLLFDTPCENLSAPTLLNFPLGSIYQEGMQGTSSFPTFLSSPLFLLSVLHSAEQHLQWMANLATLLCFALPTWLAPVFSSSLCSAAGFLHDGVALTDLQPLFICVLVWELLQTLCCG